ncbi:MAG: hypothetical protein R6U41_12495, partial [Desulfosalsimonas sp.]|uniref:dTMP kinase n=1 Tax=Desulfosalsimonas sp. TaxID=3073848 RepID=UPI0039711628
SLARSSYPWRTFSWNRLVSISNRVSCAWRQIQSGDRHAQETRFEMETIRFHEKVRQGYLDLARENPERIRVVAADAAREQVRAAIIEQLALRLAADFQP